MTLRKKIVLLNILTVILPIVLILAVWAGYIHWGNGAGLKPINRSADNKDFLTEAMNILYTFEAELSQINWDVADFPDTGLMVTPGKEQVEELDILGYHLQVETGDGICFSNLDESDMGLLDSKGKKTEGALFWSDSSLCIQDSFRVAGQDCFLTAVYNEQRADQGVRSSLLPMYMVSPDVLAVLFAVVTGCIVFTAILTSRWMNRSVLFPLGELKKGADMIAGDDLDYRIPYAGRDEFGEVCNEFDHMRKELKEAKKQQQHFEEARRDLLRGISHDLRSPLTSIKGYAQGLKDGIADTEEKQKRYYDAILTRADDLERLTDSLSLLVRLENDNSILHMETVCFDEYICQFLSEKEPWLIQQQIEVDYRNEAGNAEVSLDIREMHRVFMNLFENTVRYRVSDRSRVKLSVTSGADNLEIRFCDDGPGVDPRHLDHLFESFYRADESRTNPGKGSGLGLAVVKRIIEGHGGSIYAVSENGLCIVMSIPMKKGGNDR